MRKTKSDDYLNGLLWEFMRKAKKVNKPFDASAVIELDVELDRPQLKLKDMRDLCNQVDGVKDKYEVTKTNPELCMLMVHKNQEALYV